MYEEDLYDRSQPILRVEHAPVTVRLEFGIQPALAFVIGLALALAIESVWVFGRH